MIVIELPGCLNSKAKGGKQSEREGDGEAAVIPSRHPACLPQMTPRVLVLAASYNYHSAAVKDSV